MTVNFRKCTLYFILILYVLESGYGFVGGVFCLFICYMYNRWVLLIETGLVLPYLILQISEDKSNQCVTTLYMSSQIEKGDHDYYFFIIFILLFPR